MSEQTYETVIHRYFAALDGYDVDAVLDCYTANLIYTRPSLDLSSTAALDLVIGREQLREYLLARGPQDTKHEIRRVATAGPVVFVEGIARGIDPPVAFMSNATVDESGRIARYISMAARISADAL
jgi:ketosteroid isomerase-like protein